jgi:hypothetical protein
MKTSRTPVEHYKGVEIFESHTFYEWFPKGIKSQILYDAQFRGTGLSGTLPEIRSQIDEMAINTVNRHFSNVLESAP